MGSPLPRPLRILAADDSAVMRRVLKTIFDLHGDGETRGLPAMVLCEVVRDGLECVAAVERLQPDVLLLDLEMPRMNGLEVLRKLASIAPALPVIMCSAYTESGARATLDALACGAKDYVMKPSSQCDFAAALDLLMSQLLPRIAALAKARIPMDRSNAGEFPQPSPPTAKLPSSVAGKPDFGLRTAAAMKAAHATPSVASAAGKENPVKVSGPTERPVESGQARIDVVVIGVSTGGPSALEKLLPMLPADFPVPVLVVQHMPKLFTGALAERLDRCSSLRVLQGVEGGLVEPGIVWLAPGDAHMEVGWGETVDRRRPRRCVLKLNYGESVNHCRPSVDNLFFSAVRLYGANTLAVILTGMGADGLEGCRAVSHARGQVLAQDERTSAVWGMPGQVTRAGLAGAVLPLNSIAAELTQRTAAGRATPAVLGDAHRFNPSLEAAYGVL